MASCIKIFILYSVFVLCSAPATLVAQTVDTLNKSTNDNRLKALRVPLNKDGSLFFQLALLNQTWLRYNENNPGTTRFSRPESETFDIGLRRTRIQLFGQITPRAFVYFQFGQNNFNSTYNYTGNRKQAAFFHDALCEYRVSKQNQLKIGAGLTIANGMSRFSQPSVSTIMTLDVPVFLQYSVDQTDQFDRRLAVFARGQIKRFDYRVYVSDPFPISSNGTSAQPIGSDAAFVSTTLVNNGSGPGVKKQGGGYLTYNFFESEAHLTPYTTGTYLGTKKVWNVSAGAVFQPEATWHRNTVNGDTVYNNMLMLGFETFLDMPVNKEKKSAVNFFAGYFLTDYGQNYLRYNGLLNPGTGSTATNLVQPNAYGNAFPMFGTGQVVYIQGGYLIGTRLDNQEGARLLPYFLVQHSNYQKLQNKNMTIVGVGLNVLMDEHRSKLSLEFQNRPTFYSDINSDVKVGPRKNAIILQYQIAI